jgi:hypothetical protein
MYIGGMQDKPREVDKAMKTKKMASDIFRGVLILCVGVLLLSGCDAALTVGGRTMGVRSGNFIFTDGYLTSSYNFHIDKVWKACEKTLTDMKASDLDKKMKISTGAMTAVIQDDKIQINVEYASQTQTLVSIRIGMAGNNMASQLIHEKIAGNLLKSVEQEKP